MKLTKNSWHHTFYMLTYGKESNHNFCDYFWSLVFAMILLPVSWVSYIIWSLASSEKKYKPEYYCEKREQWIADEEMTFMEKYMRNHAPLWFKSFISVAVQLVIFGIISGLIFHTRQFLVTSAYFILGSVVIASVIIGIYKFSKSSTVEKIDKNVSEIRKIAKEGVKSIKEKYCPRIDWQ